MAYAKARARNASARSVARSPNECWPRESNPVRLGSYVSRAQGASGDCGLSAGVLAAGPVERTLAHSEPHARSGLASQLRGLASNPAVNRLRAILSGRVSGGVADERTMPVGRTAFGNHKAATGGFGSL